MQATHRERLCVRVKKSAREPSLNVRSGWNQQRKFPVQASNPLTDKGVLRKDFFGRLFGDENLAFLREN